MTRHASLAEQLKGVLSYRNRPEGPVEPVQTNWSTVAANDNNPEDLAGMRTERRWAMRPTPDEIMAEVDLDEEEFGFAVDENGKKHKITVALGKLRFSDGTQTERGHKLVLGEAVEAQIRMPVGALLGTRDRQERALGGDTITSNAGYTIRYGGKHPGKVRRKAKKEVNPLVFVPSTKEEAVADLVKARANTSAIPPVTTCKDGFPWKPSNLRELFLGLEKTPSGESGSIEWRDITSFIADREVWAASMAVITHQDRTTLDTALTASSFADVGVAAGQSRQYADKRGGGKKRLIAANNNLMDAIRKLSA